ncbi:hypothetical protein GW17_00055485 [Ensete ventricosum]|nr:hypothetical protein GW17_00055485 [Ensete ventricosum]
MAKPPIGVARLHAGSPTARRQLGRSHAARRPQVQLLAVQRPPTATVAYRYNARGWACGLGGRASRCRSPAGATTRGR